MEGMLIMFTIIMAVVCLLGFFNEKVTHLPHEIALLLFSVLFGFLLLPVFVFFKGTPVGETLRETHYINIEGFLLEGVLCLMLFAGSLHMKLSDFKEMARQITVLAFICTLLGAVFYGFLFYGAGRLLGLRLSLPVCLMFGSIIAPTDPIAATGILSKFGLPKKLSFLIQGESLFNDGVGVALFVVFSGLVSQNASGGFLAVMAKEIFGAVLVGTVVTLLCFQLYRHTRSKELGLFTSLLTVSAAYVICERAGFSGAIASVICGILFSALRERHESEEKPERREHFEAVWETVDVLLNSILYVMLGLSFVHILQMDRVIILSVTGIVINLIARGGSLAVSSFLMGKLPDGYDRASFVKLLTWGGLRGGLSVALAMSTKEMLPEEIYFILLGCTYAIVFFTTVIQGLTVRKVYEGIREKLGNR